MVLKYFRNKFKVTPKDPKIQTEGVNIFFETIGVITRGITQNGIKHILN